MSAKYRLSVPFFHFWPKLTHPAARSLCDSWASCFTIPLVRWPSRQQLSSCFSLVSQFGVTVYVCYNCHGEWSSIQNAANGRLGRLKTRQSVALQRRLTAASRRRCHGSVQSSARHRTASSRLSDSRSMNGPSTRATRVWYTVVVRMTAVKRQTLSHQQATKRRLIGIRVLSHITGNTLMKVSFRFSPNSPKPSMQQHWRYK